MAKKNTRETSRTIMVSARINKVFLERLDAIAKADGRTRSELVDRAVEEFVRTHEPKPAKKPA